MDSGRIPPNGTVALWEAPEDDDARPDAASDSPPIAPAVMTRTALRPRDTNPLDAAFRRPPLVTANLNEATESEVVATRGPTLVAYGRFDPRAKPVVLVHGVLASGEQMTALADRLTTVAGRQVYVFQYDDASTSTSTNGRHLATALRELNVNTRHRDEPLEIVGHSMGGVIARVAMNELERLGRPRAGFPSARVQNLDTSQAGQWDGASWTRSWLTPMVNAGLRSAGLNGLVDMGASTPMFSGLYATQLRDVTFSNVVARDPSGRPGPSANLHDFSAEEQVAIASYLIGGSLPGEPMPRNYAQALESDVNGPALRARLRDELETQPPAAAMRAAFDAVMPQVRTTHDGILESPATDAIVRSLTPSWPGGTRT